MDVESFIEIYRPLIVIAFYVSLINWLGYTVLAPWYKSALGRIVWTKFLANVLILFTPFMQVMYSDVPFRYEISLGAMIFFIVAISLVGVGIYTTQIQGYRIYKNQLRKSRKRMKEEENAGPDQ